MPSTFPPLWLTADQATELMGLTRRQFDRQVAAVKLPLAARHYRGQPLWDRDHLELLRDGLPPLAPELVAKVRRNHKPPTAA
jgi:hypothetical protein